uniref:Chromodomain helicase DNA binding protein 1-like n=1 Tax=Tetraodon nigroviridis TaxID=99883 RepID=H3CH38_TETNG
MKLTQGDTESWGLRGIQLKPYQLDGVQWLSRCFHKQQGCILGDEMGLGKTCQSISLLLYLSGALQNNGPFLVLSPLSVLENWRKEFSIAPSLKVLVYKGDKARRAELQKEINSHEFHVVLTTYELCLKDASFLRRWKWAVLVVDEAHRLKNPFSKLRQSMMEFSVTFRLLLTGTPIQNNLQEIYSLLNFIQPKTFKAEDTEKFITSYCDLQHQPALAAELQELLEPFLLRRVKGQVDIDVPHKQELVIYHGITALQKKYYKAFLLKDHGAFQNEQRNKTRLLNILINLRKCVNHPYMFEGVEPEPFEMGEHLIEASGKLSLLDNLLTFLLKEGHRVLLFSQMTRMLDIVQDYMEYRGYSYERLDGSIRGEERNLAVKNFSSNDIFAFLLSTKAGGVGLNLTAADTVIFIDSDFNPHNDLQAAARCHRIGQDRPVKVIRLIGRDTVEEIMYCRAASKLNLTKTVMEDGRFSLLDQAQSAAAGLQLSEILSFGMDKLLSSEESSVDDVNLEKILGPSRHGRWLDEDLTASRRECEGAERSSSDHLYYFEGKDYSKVPSAADQIYLQQLMKEHVAEFLGAAGSRTLRQSITVQIPSNKRKYLTSQATAKKSKVKQKSNKNKRTRLFSTKEKKSKEEPAEASQCACRMAWWQSCGYTTRSLPSTDSACPTDPDTADIHYVLGDVTHPHSAEGDAIIVHCVDDSGWWGTGGLFTALEMRSDEPRKQYDLAGRMKDLDLGNVLFFPIDDKQSRSDGQDHLALIVAQRRDKANNLSGIHLSALDKGLKKIYVAAKKSKASVHLPRIGHSTKGFNWYGTERLIRKHLASRGVPTFMY